MKAKPGTKTVWMMVEALRRRPSRPRPRGNGMTHAAGWRANFERRKRFAATELGELYRRHEHALIGYWRRDGDDSVSFNKLKELDARTSEATQPFVELAGV
jgi:hypothetical protein